MWFASKVSLSTLLRFVGTSPENIFSFRLSSLSLSSLCSYVPERKLTTDEEEAKRIAEMGKPVLGEHGKLEVIIEESYEFKVGKVPLRRQSLRVETSFPMQTDNGSATLL